MFIDLKLNLKNLYFPFILKLFNKILFFKTNFYSNNFYLKIKFPFFIIKFNLLKQENMYKIKYIFYFIHKMYLFTFLNYLKNYFKFFNKGFKVKIKVKTYFFRIFSSLSSLYLDMRSSHLYELVFPLNFFVFTKKRSLLVYGLSKFFFKYTINSLLNFKPFNIYTGKGLHLSKSKFKKKKGKIR